jgi:uncharacterized protein (TIGR03000 family)
VTRGRYRAVALLALAMTVVLLLPETAQAQRRGILRRRILRGPSEVRTYRVYSPPQVRYVYPPGYLPPSFEPDEEVAPSVASEPQQSESRIVPAADESGAPARPDATSAVFAVLMPTADAELWVGDLQVKGSGTTREIVTQPLRPGERHTFIFRVRWLQGDREAEDRRVVEARAGDRITVEFARPARRDSPGEIVPREYPGPKP